MDRDLDVRFPDARASGRFADTEAFQLRVSDQTRLFGWQVFKQTLNVQCRRAGVLKSLRDQDVAQPFDRTETSSASEMVHQLVTSYCVQPRGEGPVSIVTGAAIVNRNQSLLHEILGIVLGVANATSIEGPQQGNERRQQRRMGLLITTKARHHHRPKLLLAAAQISSSESFAPRAWLVTQIQK